MTSIQPTLEKREAHLCDALLTNSNTLESVSRAYSNFSSYLSEFLLKENLHREPVARINFFATTTTFVKRSNFVLKMADALLVIQIRVVNNIINFLKNTKSKKSAASQTISYFEARLQLLQRYFNDFLERHQTLIQYESEKKEHEYFRKDAFDLAETAYVDALAELSDDIERLRKGTETVTTPPIQNANHQGNPNTNVDHVKVPRVSLPSFSGQQDEWELYKQRFSSLIGNKTEYSDIDKLQYLLSTLQGKAAARLHGIEVTGPNFKVAWDKLLVRYDNKRRRLSNHLENLMMLPSVRSRSVRDLSDLVDKVEVWVRALEELGCNIEQFNHWLVHCILRKLNSHTKETWKISQESTEGFYRYKDLIKFLERRIDSLESELGQQDPRTAGGSSNKPVSIEKPHKFLSTLANTIEVSDSGQSSSKPTFTCPLCQGKHLLHLCEQFKLMNSPQRYNFCKKSRLCLNCLRKSHVVSDCKSLNRCLICRPKHHKKLHFDNKNSTLSGGDESQSHSSPPTESEALNSCSAHLASAARTVLLATAKILVCDQFGKIISARALIDPGAQRSFITERLASQLTVDRRSASVEILGVGGQITSRAQGEVTVSLKSSSSKTFNCTCVALVLRELTCWLPPPSFPAKDWPNLNGLHLADPTFALKGKIDMILGADLYGLILRDGFIRGPADAPVAQSTVFGWILTGIVDSTNSAAFSSAVTAYHTVTDSSLSQTLIKFWEIEELPISCKLSPEEEYCEEYISSTYSRAPDGRFVVRLPFARREPFFDSRDLAVACLLRSEKSRHRNLELQAAYSDFMKEYIQLGHMRATNPLLNNHFFYFLPHHAVFRPGSNKIRVVFNASQKSSAGYSLNDLLWPGPKLQSDITLVITRWRFFRVVIVTDIQKMFRQIRVHPDDLNWQRLVWRETPTSPIQDYQALTVTYGTACAPFLAMRSLLQLAKDGRKTHPRASFLLMNQIYVDDVFLGDDEDLEAKTQRDQLIDLLASAGMKLGKWSSNKPELLHGLPREDVIELPTSSGEIVSTLGLKWDTGADVFRFEASLLPSFLNVPCYPTRLDYLTLWDSLLQF